MGAGPLYVPEKQDQWDCCGEHDPFGIVGRGDEIGPVEDGDEKGKNCHPIEIKVFSLKPEVVGLDPNRATRVNSR